MEKKTREQLLREIKDLQLQLKEAQETLNAIRNGQVDAIVIGSLGSEQVYTLKGADYTYRILMEQMSEGAFTIDTKGTILYCNKRLADFLKKPLEKVIGTHFRKFIPPSYQSIYNDLVKRARKETSKGELRLVAEDGTEIPVNLSLNPLQLEDTAIISGVVTDLTEKKLHEEVISSERLNRAILEQTGDAIVVCNENGLVIKANRKAFSLIGTNPLQKPFDQVFPLFFSSESTPISDELRDYNDRLLLSKPLKGEAIENVERYFARKDGEKIYLLINASPLLDDDKKVRGCVISLTEISHQKKIETELKKRKAELDTILTSMKQGIAYLDENNNVLYLNRQFANLLGIKYEDAFRKNIFEFHPPEKREKVKALINDFRKGRKFSNKVLERKGKYIELAYNRVTGAHGDYHGIVLSAIDITERVQSEKKIREYSNDLKRMVESRTRELKRALYDTEEARDRIDAILKSIGDGLVVTDTYNRILLMNPNAEDLLGVRLSEVINRPIDFAIRDKTLREKFKEALDKKVTGTQFDFELPVEDRTYSRIMRARTSVIQDKAGNQTGTVTIIYDITHEREMDRLKTEFISIAAHELRTPLTSIQGFSELLLTRDDLKKEEEKRFLSYINKQSLHLANIIDTLLDISRIESGKGLTLNRAPCNINDIIRETVGYFKTFSPKHRFDVILPGGSMELMVDKERMRQVFENILSNAIKYSPEDSLIQVIGQLSGDYYQVSIKDQGIGMTPDQMEKIFDKFYRVDTSNSSLPGIGLGMSIVKNIVDAHGGRIWVESELGKGTTVRFTIPRK
nr:PAS domain-containing sensor histidine kinase [Desulfobacterales bacterium]